MKTNKSYTKRVKVTKNGKVKARKTGQNHFNARATGQKTLSKRRSQNVSWGSSNRVTRRFLPNTK